MESQLAAPEMLAAEIPIGELDGTIGALAAAAARAGYTIRATRALGTRVPRVTTQQPERQASVALVGVMHDWTFTALHTTRDGWDVLQHRPGWPTTPSNLTQLRATLKAQTPTDLGRAPVSR